MPLSASEIACPEADKAAAAHHEYGAEILAASSYLRRVIPFDWNGPLRLHNFHHSLATALVKLDPKTTKGVSHYEDFGTTMELYAQSDMDSMRDAQGKFPSSILDC